MQCQRSKHKLLLQGDSRQIQTTAVISTTTFFVSCTSLFPRALKHRCLISFINPNSWSCHLSESDEVLFIVTGITYYAVGCCKTKQSNNYSLNFLNESKRELKGDRWNDSCGLWHCNSVFILKGRTLYFENKIGATKRHLDKDYDSKEQKEEMARLWGLHIGEQ